MLAHEALFRIGNLLDQFKAGLGKTGALKLITAFPAALFQEFFTCSGVVTAQDVVNAVYVDRACDLTEAERKTMEFLHKYLGNASEDGKS